MSTRRKETRNHANISKPEIDLVHHGAVEMLPPENLKPYPRNARTHSKKQVKQIAASIKRFSFTNPVLIDEADQIIAGHGRVAASLDLGLSEVPTLRLGHLSDADKRAYILADNRLAEKAGWDREVLAIELGELSVLLPGEIEITGFETVEIDLLLSDLGEEADPADEAPAVAAGPPVTRPGDLWVLGAHRLACGDARDEGTYERLMAGEAADMVFTDPPYNVPISGHVLSRGSRHREFAFASGEMTRTEFVSFLTATLGLAARHARDGSIHYVCSAGHRTSPCDPLSDTLHELCHEAGIDGATGERRVRPDMHARRRCRQRPLRGMADEEQAMVGAALQDHDIALQLRLIGLRLHLHEGLRVRGGLRDDEVGILHHASDP